MLSGEVSGASAQADDGAGDIEIAVAAGTLDDGQALLPQAGISLEAAGEVDLEYADDRLAFNVGISDQDVKVDASSGAVLSVGMDD